MQLVQDDTTTYITKLYITKLREKKLNLIQPVLEPRVIVRFAKHAYTYISSHSHFKSLKMSANIPLVFQ